MYILWSWNKILQTLVFLIWYQSHCSDLFLAVLSLLVLLHSQHRFRRHNSRRSLLPLNLRHLPVVVFGFGPTAAIVEESYTAQTIARVIIAVNITPITFLQVVSLRSSCTNLHVSGSLAVIGDRTHRPKLLHQIPRAPRAVLSSSWCHPWRHQCHVNPNLRQLPVICLTSSTNRRPRWLWPLTFLQVWLLQSKFFLPSFSHRFHFCCLFLHVVSLNG